MGTSISDILIGGKLVVDYNVRGKGAIQDTKGVKANLKVHGWRNRDAVAQEKGLESHCSRPPLLLLLLLDF